VASSPHPSSGEVPVPSSVAHDLLILLFIVQLIVLNVWWTRLRQSIHFNTYRAPVINLQALAHHLVHEVAQRLAHGCVPVFSSDGLALYFYALTAHFGSWVQAAGERRRRWTVNIEMLYAQVIKCYRAKRVVGVHQHVYLGTAGAYRQAMRSAGFSGRIQTAFIERLNLTLRRSIAGLARQSWSTLRSVSELTLQFEWWRAVYHFARPHASLRQVIDGRTPDVVRPRYRQRTPAQAAGLVSRRWTVQQLLTYPAPPLSSAR